MILHTGIPTRSQVDRLFHNRNPMSVSIYLATDPASPNVVEWIELKNLESDAARQLHEANAGSAAIAAIERRWRASPMTRRSGAIRREALRSS